MAESRHGTNQAIAHPKAAGYPAPRKAADYIAMN
jgi:hypothetical protein